MSRTCFVYGKYLENTLSNSSAMHKYFLYFLTLYRIKYSENVGRIFFSLKSLFVYLLKISDLIRKNIASFAQST